MKSYEPFVITIIIFLSYSISSIAQAEKTSDYLVLNSGDTLYGNVKHIDERGVSLEFYKKIRFKSEDGKKKKYKREKVIAFKADNINYEGFWLNQTSSGIMLLNPRYDIDSRNGELYFLKVVSKGKLSHYELEWFEQGESTLWGMDLLKKEEDSYFIRATQGLLGLKRKTLANFFLDCPRLAEKIKQKQFKNISQIIGFYHSDCVD